MEVNKSIEKDVCMVCICLLKAYKRVLREVSDKCLETKVHNGYLFELLKIPMRE